MDSFPNLSNYYMSQSLSSVLEIEYLPANPCMHYFPYVSRTLSSDDKSVQLLTVLYSMRIDGEIEGTYFDVHLHKSPPKALLMLAASLLAVNGEKYFTQYFVQMSTQLGSKPIQSKISSGREIDVSLATLLHQRNLKVQVEVLVWRKSAPLTPLTSDYASLLATGAYSDVTLIVGQKEFSVHKLILSVRSPVFARMLASNFKESKENRVVIEDISEEVLQELLNFIYTERVENLAKNAAELLMAAEKYQIESLKLV